MYVCTPDKQKLILNDMTHLSTPDPTEYCFQFKQPEPHQASVNIKNIVDSSNEFDNVTLRAKLIRLGETRNIGKRQLRLATATFLDETGTILVDLWENHIDNIHLGSIYHITFLQVFYFVV